jgi:hypothetical protein
MQPQMMDFRTALFSLGLPMLFVAVCSISALLMLLLAPKRFRAARLLLCLPLMGMIVGFPVGFAIESRPGLLIKLQYAAMTALWMGTSCTTFFMLIGFFILGVASLVRAATGGSAPVKRLGDERSDLDSVQH